MRAGATHLAHAADLLRTIPRFTADAKRLALELYRQLALGKPVAHEDLAASLGVTADEAFELGRLFNAAQFS